MTVIWDFKVRYSSFEGVSTDEAPLIPHPNQTQQILIVGTAKKVGESPLRCGFLPAWYCIVY